jgi:hypothetical protein
MVRWRAAERIVRYESVTECRLIVSDDVSKLERERRWNGDAAGMIEKVRGHVRVPIGSQNPVDDVFGIKCAYTSDDGIKI